jgi:integrase
MLAAEVMLEVARGKDPAAEKCAERSKGTFGELAGPYVEEYAKHHNKSWRQADTLVRRHLLSRWGALQAASISRSDIKAMMTGIEAPVVANQTLAAASAIFSWAMKEELVAVNPCRGIDRNPIRSRERILTDSEVPRFWAAFDDAGLIAGAALKVILLTGQRPGEVAHMRREHTKDGWWEMPGEPVPSLGWPPGTKNAQAHRVWLPVPVQALLAVMGDAGAGFVFAGPRGRAARSLDEAMRKICDAS